MTKQDDVTPYRAKEAAPGQEAADVVAEVLQHAAEREKAGKQRIQPKGPPKWMLPVTVNLGVLALYFIIAQPDFLIVSPIEDTRPDAEVIQSTRQGVYFDGIMRIDAFIAANGRAPSSLEEAGSFLASQGVNYTVQGDSAYILILTIGDETIIFDSAVDSSSDFVGAINLPG
jgi:hypothetical protein